ncbi:NNMT/PNMT/TEMT family domain-containing protein [Ditylenchus destructor]|nr:NNMT/PNMT/TEMT family domain-containing protein [Ditylenchus destructor]
MIDLNAENATNHTDHDQKDQQIRDNNDLPQSFHSSAQCGLTNQSCSSNKENEGTANSTSGEILDRTHFLEKFDAKEYLKDFYTKVDDAAMQMVLIFLPNVVARFDHAESLLDFGAGPTIHVAVCFRHKVDEIYLADYLPQNRNELTKWVEGRCDFDWTATLKIIDCREGGECNITTMEQDTREKIRGVLHCDCHTYPAIESAPNGRGKFDIITTFFTLEYCCNTQQEYSAAIRRVTHHLKPGGWLIMGGILEETWCSFGGRKYTCLYITRDFMLDCLRQAGMCLKHISDSSYNTEENDDDKIATSQNGPCCMFFEVNGMFLVCCRKTIQSEDENSI